MARVCQESIDFNRTASEAKSKRQKSLEQLGCLGDKARKRCRGPRFPSIDVSDSSASGGYCLHPKREQSAPKLAQPTPGSAFAKLLRASKA